MSEAPEQGAETLAPAETPSPEAQEGAAATGVAAEGSEAATEAPAGQEAPAAEEPKKPKSPVSQLQGRVGHLTRTLHEKDTALTQAQKELETYKALLQGQGGAAPEAGASSAAPTVHSSTLVRGSPEYQEAVKTEARQLAASEAFTRDCNAIYDAGLKSHGETFKEAVANLGALGMMNETVIQAAMATGQAPEVLNHLGADVDEAARITALPPVQMAVELTKLATKLSAPKEGPQVSRAPAPITPIGGASQVGGDVYDPGLTDDEYYRRRANQGAKWIKPSK